MRDKFTQLISSINPHDALEQKHITQTLAWISSGAPLFRVQKPADPPKHLVSYIVLFDQFEKKVLLVHHNKAKLWLPAGGHVETDEHPKTTAVRELKEELGITAPFVFEHPVFITVTQTRNIDSGHTDVSLWYVMNGDSKKLLSFDASEMSEYQWFSFEEALALNDCDPHLHRFIQKLVSLL